MVGPPASPSSGAWALLAFAALCGAELGAGAGGAVAGAGAGRAGAPAVGAQGGAAERIAFWNMSQAIASGDLQSLNELVLALTYQGLANRGPQGQGAPALFINSTESSAVSSYYFYELLQSTGRVEWQPVPPTICGLVESGVDAGRVKGLVAYNETGGVGDGYSMAISITLAAQRSLLPVTTLSLQRHPCLRNMTIALDLRKPRGWATRADAWRWAIAELLPHSSKTVVTNLDRYQPTAKPGGKTPHWDAQNVMATLDYAVSQNAFVLDHQPHCHGRAGGPGGTASNCSAQPPHGGFGEDDEMILEVFSKLEPLFSVFGWADSETLATIAQDSLSDDKLI